MAMPMPWGSDTPALAILRPASVSAQAMAVHAALLAGDAAERPAAGFLASVRDVQWQVPRLDDLPTPLCVAASRLTGDGNNGLSGQLFPVQQQRIIGDGNHVAHFGAVVHGDDPIRFYQRRA